jgi:transposase
MKRLNNRKQHTVQAFHVTAARFLHAVFSRFFLPKFEVGRMTRRTRRIGRAVSRRLRALNHYAFRQRLIQVCEPSPLHPNHTSIIICDESFTTQCCGTCGHMVQGVAASKIVRCPCCHARQDRDGGAARNIFLKVLFRALLQHPRK